jgi:hypothetical protein
MAVPVCALSPGSGVPVPTVTTTIHGPGMNNYSFHNMTILSNCKPEGNQNIKKTQYKKILCQIYLLGLTLSVCAVQLARSFAHLGSTLQQRS